MNNFRVLTIYLILIIYFTQDTWQAAHTHAKKVSSSFVMNEYLNK